MTDARPKVVVGIDGSESAEHALLWAAQEATRRGATLVIAHAGDVPDADVLTDETRHEVASEVSDYGTALLQDAVDIVQEGFCPVEVNSVLREANPADLLTELSAEASLVVVGRSRHNPIERLLLGSNARRVADRAHCPVVVVSDEVPTTGGPIVVGVSETDNGRLAMQMACDEARLRSAELVAIRSWPDIAWAVSGIGFPLTTPLAGIEQAQQRLLDEMVAATRSHYADVRLTPHLSAQPTDIALTSVEDAALLVVGRRRTTAQISRLGPITSWLIEHATCPVMVVGGDTAQAEAPELATAAVAEVAS